MAARSSNLVTLGEIKILQGRMSVNELPHELQLKVTVYAMRPRDKSGVGLPS
jgi:hypothetical protein